MKAMQTLGYNCFEKYTPESVGMQGQFSVETEYFETDEEDPGDTLLTVVRGVIILS